MSKESSVLINNFNMALGFETNFTDPVSYFVTHARLTTNFLVIADFSLYLSLITFGLAWPA